jgi:hypothetical protein
MAGPELMQSEDMDRRIEEIHGFLPGQETDRRDDPSDMKQVRR